MPHSSALEKITNQNNRTCDWALDIDMGNQNKRQHCHLISVFIVILVEFEKYAIRRAGLSAKYLKKKLTSGQFKCILSGGSFHISSSLSSYQGNESQLLNRYAAYDEGFFCWVKRKLTSTKLHNRPKWQLTVGPGGVPRVCAKLLLETAISHARIPYGLLSQSFCDIISYIMQFSGLKMKLAVHRASCLDRQILFAGLLIF